jgi:hypothetical protein
MVLPVELSSADERAAGTSQRLWDLAALAVSVVGLVLRIEHAQTFDGPARGSDYSAYVEGARWVLTHHRAFDVSVPIQHSSQPPLWFAIGALILALGRPERDIALVASLGWGIRQALLGRMLREAAPSNPMVRFAALSLHAVLPLSVLMDGKVNPEGLHATLFMVALYFLWRLEREETRGPGMRVRTAALFGLCAGLALLTKATSVSLVIAAALLFAGCALRDGIAGLRGTVVRLVRPALAAAAVWLAVTGWWCGPNLVHYGHPFPHSWAVNQAAMIKSHPVLGAPVTYRRPLGWFLPFQFDYLKLPMAVSEESPRPNFWTVAIAGTWADYLNRGFCRLGGEEWPESFWGDWDVTRACVRQSRALVWLGLPLSIAAALSWFYMVVAFVREKGKAGSLVLPVASGLALLFVMSFALVYPLDENAVLKHNYMLAAAAPLVACLGLAIASLAPRPSTSLLRGVFLALTACIGVLLVMERWPLVWL